MGIPRHSGDAMATSKERLAKSAPIDFTASGHSTGNNNITVICCTQLTIDFSSWLPGFARLQPKRRSSSTMVMTAMAKPAVTQAVNVMDADMSSAHFVQVEVDAARCQFSSQTAQSTPLWPSVQYLQVRVSMCARACACGEVVMIV